MLCIYIYPINSFRIHIYSYIYNIFGQSLAFKTHIGYIEKYDQDVLVTV